MTGARSSTVCCACGKPAYWSGCVFKCAAGHAQKERSPVSRTLNSKSLAVGGSPDHNWKIVTLAKPSEGVTITLVVNETEVMGWYPGVGLRVFRALRGTAIPEKIFTHFMEAIDASL